MRGEPASWMGAPETLAKTHRTAPHGSWWTNVERGKWDGAVFARWKGPAPAAPTESTPRLGLGRRQSKPPKPRGR